MTVITVNLACRGSLTAKAQPVQVVVADDKDSDTVKVFAADQYDGKAENITRAVVRCIRPVSKGC